jgi:hydrogenase expression/formation protein HypC
MHDFHKKPPDSDHRLLYFMGRGCKLYEFRDIEQLIRKKISMCIAWPMCVKELLPGKECIAETDGVSRKISWRLLDTVELGDHVLVHAGYAIEKIDLEAAREQLKIMEELKENLSRSN